MRKWGVWVVATASAAFVLSGCTAALIGGAGAGGYYAGKDHHATRHSAGDAAITSAVKSKLLVTPEVKSLKLNVETHEGVVSLRGEVRTAKQWSAAERAARSVEGVKDVKNELRLKG